MTTYTLVPAYGRDYKNKKDVMADWNADKDFKLESFYGHGYVNKKDALRYFQKGDYLQIRYVKLTKICLIKI